MSQIGPFVKNFATKPKSIGAVTPSSRYLARAMMAVAKPLEGEQVLELGPGTGVFTRALLDEGVAPENLSLVEFCPGFRESLTHEFPEIAIVGEDAFAYFDSIANREPKIDLIVSGLPLLNFSNAMREKLRNDMLRCLSDKGRMVQFTYGPNSPLPLSENMSSEVSRRVWRNIPPARVWTYRHK